MAFDFSLVPVEIWCDLLEEEGIDTQELRLWAEYGCFTCTQQDTWARLDDFGVSVEGHTDYLGRAQGEGTILAFEEESSWSYWWIVRGDYAIGKSVYTD